MSRLYSGMHSYTTVRRNWFVERELISSIFGTRRQSVNYLHDMKRSCVLCAKFQSPSSWTRCVPPQLLRLSEPFRPGTAGTWAGCVRVRCDTMRSRRQRTTRTNDYVEQTITHGHTRREFVLCKILCSFTTSDGQRKTTATATAMTMTTDNVNRPALAQLTTRNAEYQIWFSYCGRTMMMLMMVAVMHRTAQLFHTNALDGNKLVCERVRFVVDNVGLVLHIGLHLVSSGTSLVVKWMKNRVVDEVWWMKNRTLP